MAELGYTNSGQNSPRTVIVIGGTGYLGAAVVAHLTMAGANAIPVRHGSLDDHPQDMFDLSAILASTSGPSDSQRWDFTVIDLSSGTRQEASALEPDWHAVSRLVARRMETLKVLADSGMSHLVFVSSGGALFPYSNRQPVGETGEARPHSTYGILKLVGSHRYGAWAVFVVTTSTYRTLRLPSTLQLRAHAYQASFTWARAYPLSQGSSLKSRVRFSLSGDSPVEFDGLRATLEKVRPPHFPRP